MQKYIMCVRTVLLATIVFSWCSCNCKQLQSPQKFTLLTMLYNEKNAERCQEYITCMEQNLQHPLIDHIHVFFDTSSSATSNRMLEYVKSKPVSITYIRGRATYAELVQCATDKYSQTATIISNADIYFDSTLSLLETYDLSHKFLALTRWDIHKDRSESLAFSSWDAARQQYVPFSGRSYCQDTWIFETPLPTFKDSSMELGAFHFDPRLAFQAQQAGLQVINPCFTIKCHHFHLSKIRHYPWIHPTKPMLTIPFSALDLNRAVKSVVDFCLEERSLPLLGLEWVELDS